MFRSKVLRLIVPALVVVGLFIITGAGLDRSGSQIASIERLGLETASGAGAFHYTVKVANGYNGAKGIATTLRTPTSGNHIVVTDIAFNWLRMENGDSLNVALYNGVATTDSVWHWATNANDQRLWYSFSPRQAIVLTASAALVVQAKSTSLGKGTTIPDTLFMNIYGHEILP